jgi:hypothetical protein
LLTHGRLSDLILFSKFGSIKEKKLMFLDL